MATAEEYPVTLSVDGFEPRRVKQFTYKFNQSIDDEGQLTGVPRGGLITIRVKPIEGNDELLNWMLKRSLNKSGKISFLSTQKGGDGNAKTIEFTDAFCIDYTEHYEEDNKQAQYEEIVITCRSIKNNSSEYVNTWV